jgi:hypothetical protein
MNNKRDSKKSRIEAIVIALLFIGTALIVPVGTIAQNAQNNTKTNDGSQKNFYTEDGEGTFILDRSYYLRETDPASMNTADNDDAGYKKDAGIDLNRALALYPGETPDETPGRGRSGKLSSTDLNDWYLFSVCQGQQIVFTVTPPSGFDIDLSLWTSTTSVISSNNSGSTPETVTWTASYTGKWYVNLRYVSGSGTGQYTFSVAFNGQNDSGTGQDAGDNFAAATLLTPGCYYGYLDMNDPYDWYKFNVNDGQGIHLTLKMKDIAYLTDFDLQLYNPIGKLVYEGNEYYDDDLLYPADVTGEWSVRVDIFPGWVDVPTPTEWSYYSYGSGAYNLTLAIETSAPAAPGPIPQSQITPIAKTFKITNDPASTKDDFGYLAAIPACNYLADDGKRYLAPIIYTGDSTPTAYYDDPTAFGTVDDTTQYLIDDWNAYLDTYGKTPVNYTVPADPIQAAADIATQNWDSSQTAVVAVDGSGFNDTVKTVLKRTATLKREVKVENVPGNSTKIKNIGGAYGYPMFLGPKWCALNVSMFGTGGATPTIGAIIPLYMTMQWDWWPSPEDAEGPKTDMYYPVNRMGVWVAGTDIVSPNWNFKITKYAGDRYRFRVTNADSVINAKITTTEASDLLLFLVDPQGNLRAPTIPAWNGPVNPIHIWNGLENPPVNPWRCWDPAPHTEFSAEVLHPEKGTWTAIVVPRDANGSNVKYTLKVDVRTVSQDRADATISAANAAVIASLNHIPLLYVTKDSVPAATASAFTALGVNKVIFVERGDIGKTSFPSGITVQADLTDMKQIVDYIKSFDASENYVTVTSLKTGDGFFAPAAMLAAYHGSPVIRVEDAPDGDPAAVAQRIHNWQRWGGDYYHGARSTNHLPQANAEVEQNKLKVYLTLIRYFIGANVTVPPYGLDAKRYWNEEMYTKFHKYIDSLGLDNDGQEGYVTVAPRDDITLELHSALMGNNSYAGDIPGDTPAYTNDIVIRDILYPALIYANPGRDITTTQLMNFPDGGQFKLNDGKYYPSFSSREVKNAFSSHLRTYEGHTFWLAHLQRMNDGASAMYYSGHGTGGSGMSGMYKQSNESNYPDQIWWDAWRGYMYDAWKMPRDNGFIWFNPKPPELYDIIHYKWIDQQMQNLHSNAIFYMSCTTGDGDSPMVYLDHGALCWYGNAGTGLCPEADIGDDAFFNDAMVNGVSIGVAFSHQVWLHYRDFTTGDPTSMYGSSTLYPVTSIQVIYGDPNLVVYSPEWPSPIPVEA